MPDLPPGELGSVPITLEITGVSIIEREPAVVVTTVSSGAPAQLETKPISFEGNKSGEPVQTPEQSKEENKHGAGEALKGKKVSKKFGRKYYNGEVISYDPETHWYKVEYEDGDSEELWWWELQYLLADSSSKKRGRKPYEGTLSSGKRVRKDQNFAKSPKTRKLEITIDLTLAENEPGGKNEKPVLKLKQKSKSAASNEASASPAPSDDGPGAQSFGKSTKKMSGEKPIKGTITGFDPDTKLYKVSYDDGTEENLAWSELKPALVSTGAEAKTYEPPPPESSSFIVVEVPDDDVQVETAATGDVQAEEIIHLQTPAPGDEPAPVYTTGIDLELEAPPEEDFQFDAPASFAEPRDLKTHPAFIASRFFLDEKPQTLKFHAWGEVVGYEKGKCPDLRAVKWLPSASPIVHLAASHHHLVALTASGQVWVWRNKHGNIQERCNQWEHVPDLDDKSIMLVDIAGQDLDRSLAGYLASEEDQVPDPFYIAAVSESGRDYILQGSHPHEPVHTRSLVEETHNLSLEELLKLNDVPVADMGRVVQVNLGLVERLDEPPFVGYITDSDRVYIRSATKDFTEEVNQVTGFSGKPLKIQCGRGYHAIIMTDDGRAWTWKKGDNIESLCLPAHAALFGRKVIDVGCYDEKYIALTEDGGVHQWAHGDSLTIKVSVTSATSEDPLKKIILGEGLSAGISSSKRLHTWRTFPRVAGKPATPTTPCGRDDKSEDTLVAELGKMAVLEVLCVPGSLVVIGKAPEGPARRVYR